MKPDLSTEVADALRAGHPVVALESTIIAHGMPWPQNVETALAVEAEVRVSGATPATVAILDGRLKAGLTRGEIERLARGGREIAKVSRRDISIVMARSGTGATTVAATMIIADMAGMRLFSTGGIGGVHRGAETTFDVSADLQELARTPVAVVCAGPKSVLDLSLTLEYLETHGVPVVGYRTDRLPSFWSRDSGLVLDVRLDEPAEIARVMQSHWQLGSGGGLVIANPIAEAFEVPRERIERAIDQALDDARIQRISGKEVTPFLLNRVNALSGGDSIAANIQLARSNAKLAAKIAVAYAALTTRA